MNLALFKKVRCRFLDVASGLPVPGAVASLSVGIGDGAYSAKLPVSSLCSDATGYMSFDLSSIADLGLLEISGLYISAPKFGLLNFELLSSIVSGSRPADNGTTVKPIEVAANVSSSFSGNTGLSSLVFPIYLETEQVADDTEETCQTRHLPSIQSPDIWDHRVSPFSFVTPAALNLGNDCCEVLAPSTLPTQQYRFSRIVIRREKADTDIPVDSADAPLLARKVEVFQPLKSPAPIIKFGEIVEYKQEWYSLGHSLGEIKYSLPLAPGESTQLAVIDWKRDDLASRTDQIRATEFLDHDSRRDRAIEETVESALREEQGGNSFELGTSGTATIPLQYVTMTGNHAIGGSVSYAYGNRNVDGNSLQDLHDRVRQASSSVRSLNSTVIVQASQSESNTLQTRRVANHNHCHALTIQYYEVLRHYRLTTQISGRRQAVLIPFEIFPFTWQLALRFRTALEQTLLDPALLACFDALIRLNISPASIYDLPTPVITTGSTSGEVVNLEKTVEVRGLDQAGVKSGIVVLKDDKVTMSASGLLAFGGSSDTGARGPEGNLGFPADNRFLAPGLDQFSLLYKIGVGGKWRQGKRDAWTITADVGGEIIFGVNDDKSNYSNNTAPGQEFWTVDMEYPSHDPAPTPTDPSKSDSTQYQIFRKSDDELCSARLLNHLQSNQGYYNGAVWSLLDAVERRLYLEEALQDLPNILDGMDDHPLAISGNYVAFQYNGPPPASSSPGLEDPLPLEDIVTLPTRGLFAEAQLGHCNACEKRDMMRMWDWTEMTTETPPDIGGITPGPKGSAPSIAQGQLPGNVVQITQPQNAPDPTALANALSVLKTPDTFRDITGLDDVTKLLDDLQKSATDANTKALAQQAKDKVDEVKKNATGSQNPNTSTASGVSAADAANRLSLLPEIKSFAKDLGLTDDEYKQFALDQVYGTKPAPKAASPVAASAKPLKVFVQGRVKRNGAVTQEPVSGVLTILLSRVLVADKQEVPVEILFDLSQGIGGNIVSLVRDELYISRPTIKMSPDSIASQLDEALAAARFELPGLDLAALTAQVKASLSSSSTIAITGSQLVAAKDAKTMTLELIADVETLQNFTTDISLDGTVGFKGNVGDQATFDTSKLGDLANAIASALKEPEEKALASGIGAILSMFTLKVDGGSSSSIGGGVTVGSKLTIKPQLLRSMTLEVKP